MKKDLKMSIENLNSSAWQFEQMAAKFSDLDYAQGLHYDMMALQMRQFAQMLMENEYEYANEYTNECAYV